MHQCRGLAWEDEFVDPCLVVGAVAPDPGLGAYLMEAVLENRGARRSVGGAVGDVDVSELWTIDGPANPDRVYGIRELATTD
jgi:hypothetical protein